MSFTPARTNLNFQAPQGAAVPVQPQIDIAGGLDSLFNAYLASKKMGDEQQLTSLSLADKYGADPRGLNPDQQRTAFAGPQVSPAPGPTQPGMPAPMQSGFDSNPVVAAIQRHIQQRDSSQKTEQDLKKSEIAKNLGAAGDSHYTLDQAAAMITPSGKSADESKAALAKLYPSGMVPKDAAHQMGTMNRMEATIGEKQTQFDAKRFSALGDALDPSKARAGAFGTSKQVFDRAERLQSLASSMKDGNLDSRQIEELAVGLNAMLSGSNTGAQSQVAALVPHSAMGNVQKLKEWLSNEPTGTNQQEFVKRMLGSVEREKATAADQIKRTQFQRAGRYADLEKSHPDEFLTALENNGIDPEEYKAWKNGGHKQLSAVQGAEGAGGNHSALLDKYGAP